MNKKFFLTRLASLLIILSLLLPAAPVLAYDAEPTAQGALDIRPEPEAEEIEDVVTYVIQEGDTIWDIGVKFDVTAQTIIWANGWLEKNPHFVLPGQELVIPPISGVLHYVRGGETLPKLAERYGVEVEDVVAYRWNGLEDASADLYVDQALIFPYGHKPGLDPLAGPPPPPLISIPIAWPTRGVITNYFRDWHRGLDIGAPAGRAVTAAAAGRVTYAGWSKVGYGNVIFIDHGQDVMTVYAHLSDFAVRTGDSVSAGQVIGKVGSTGRSTGPHLHFEVRVYGRSRDPMAYLP